MDIKKHLKQLVVYGGLALLVASGLESCDPDGPKRPNTLQRAGAGALYGTHKAVQYAEYGLFWLDSKVLSGYERLGRKQ